MFPELAPGQCDGWEAVDSRPECSARRSARMRASRTKLAMSSTNPPARAGIRDEKEPARDDEREWKPTGALLLEECDQRRKHEDQDPNVPTVPVLTQHRRVPLPAPR